MMPLSQQKRDRNLKQRKSSLHLMIATQKVILRQQQNKARKKFQPEIDPPLPKKVANPSEEVPVLSIQKTNPGDPFPVNYSRCEKCLRREHWSHYTALAIKALLKKNPDPPVSEIQGIIVKFMPSEEETPLFYPSETGPLII